jgi:hypothetical protein
MTTWSCSQRRCPDRATAFNSSEPRCQSACAALGVFETSRSTRPFLPRRGQTYQPRASPWEEAVVAPLQGLPVRCLPNPGRCPGWYVVAPLGLKSGPERPNGGRLWPEGPKHSRVEREVSYFSTFCTSALPVTANSIRYEKNLLSQNRVLNSIKFAHNPGIFCTPSWPSLESP